MSTLLHIDASPLGEASVSRHLSGEFVRKWQEANPTGKVITLDLTTSAETCCAYRINARDHRVAREANHAHEDYTADAADYGQSSSFTTDCRLHAILCAKSGSDHDRQRSLPAALDQLRTALCKYC